MPEISLDKAKINEVHHILFFLLHGEKYKKGKRAAQACLTADPTLIAYIQVKGKEKVVEYEV
jgi:hypothetical protein